MPAEKMISDVPFDVEIVVDVIGGDLIVEGSSSTDVRAKGDNPRLESNGKQIKVSCSCDCRLFVPESASLIVGTVDGDAKITMIDGAVHVTSIGGDLVVRQVGSADVHTVGGDFQVKRVTGNLQVEEVGGDANLRHIGGNVRAANVGGDALVEDVNGNCMLKSIGGDLVFCLSFAPGMEYQLNAGGDVLGKIMSDADVEFAVPQDTELEVEVPDARIHDEGNRTLITLGSGQIRVNFETIGGEMTLVPEGERVDEFIVDAVEDLEDIEDIINARISEQISHLHDHISRKTEKIHERVREATQRVEQEAERMRAKQKGFGFAWSWPEKNKRSEEKAKRTEPVSNKERLEILRMVENKQISVEEAEMLLSALEGSD